MWPKTSKPYIRSPWDITGGSGSKLRLSLRYLNYTVVEDKVGLTDIHSVWPAPVSVSLSQLPLPFLPVAETMRHGTTFSGTCEGYESDCELGLELIDNPEEVACGNVPNLVDCTSELCCQERE